MLPDIPRRYVVPALLLAWGGLILALGLLRSGPYGIEEAAARALLLNWSIVDRVVSPIVTLGMPDLRALVFAPVAIYWTGSVLAAKVFSMLIMFGAALLLYDWSRRHLDDETALIATGLLLIAPLTLDQIDTIGVGPYLLALFGAGAWLDQRYRAKAGAHNAWFFLQMLTVAVIISLHPAGLGYPLALAWRWFRDPVDTRLQRHVYVGLIIVSALVFVMQAGWIGLSWRANPLVALDASIRGPFATDGAGIGVGAVILGLALVALLADRRRVLATQLGGALTLALVTGAVAADAGWALLLVTWLLYHGTALLIRMQRAWGRRSFIGQRGLVVVMLFAVATAFMQGDKTRRQLIDAGHLPPRDRLIETFALEVSDSKEVRASSQWPGQTMLATRHPTLALPPYARDEQELLAMTRGITHLIFDHDDAANRVLAGHVARLVGVTRTVALEPGGVIVEMLPAAPDGPNTAP